MDKDDDFNIEEEQEQPSPVIWKVPLLGPLKVLAAPFTYQYDDGPGATDIFTTGPDGTVVRLRIDSHEVSDNELSKSIKVGDTLVAMGEPHTFRCEHTSVINLYLNSLLVEELFKIENGLAKSLYRSGKVKHQTATNSVATSVEATAASA